MSTWKTCSIEHVVSTVQSTTESAYVRCQSGFEFRLPMGGPVPRPGMDLEIWISWEDGE